MLSKLYVSTEVDRRTWLHVPSGTHWSTSSDTHQVVEIQKETSSKMYTPFKSDRINDMDHMRISGTIVIIGRNLTIFLSGFNLSRSRRHCVQKAVTIVAIYAI